MALEISRIELPIRRFSKISCSVVPDEGMPDRRACRVRKFLPSGCSAAHEATPARSRNHRIVSAGDLPRRDRRQHVVLVAHSRRRTPLQLAEALLGGGRALAPLFTVLVLALFLAASDARAAPPPEDLVKAELIPEPAAVTP